jgi:hypothetical protein
MPGITALAHISYRIDPAFLLSATGIYRWPEGPECLGYCSDLARFMRALQIFSSLEPT